MRNVSGRELPCYLGLNSGRSVSINVNKTRKHSWHAHVSPMFPSFPYGKHCFSVSFCFQDTNFACATRQGILTKIRACEHLQKFLEHEQPSAHLIDRRPNFASTFKLDGTIRYPSYLRLPNVPKKSKVFFIQYKVHKQIESDQAGIVKITYLPKSD